MEQNGASNGHDAKPQKSPPASGASKSPKKRRKVNHGACCQVLSSKPAASSTAFKTCTDPGPRACSLCVLPSICKYCIGCKFMRYPEFICEHARLSDKS